MKGVDVVVYADTSLEKSFPFQAISMAKIRAIVLVISIIVALIEDQIDELLILFKSARF